MPWSYRAMTILGIAALVIGAISLPRSVAQTNASADPNSLPNPYRLAENWASLPEGRSFGQVIGVKIDRDGKTVWAFERCGNRLCTNSPLAPILEFAASGKLEKSFGAGLFVFPHGLFVDRHDNIWTTDGDGADGKGHRVIKFSPSYSRPIG